MAKTAYESLAPSGQSQEPAAHVRRRPWQPSFFKRLPWLGVISIILALGCAAIAVSIAVESDGQPLDHWQVNGYVVQPAVLLSIVATIGNALLVYAFTRGATVHWWKTALDPRGITLSELHSSYHYGSGLTAIFGNIHAFNTVAVAALFMPILLIDTPLLQRSVGVVQRFNLGQTNTTIPISPAPFMLGSTGILPDHDPSPTLYHPLFAKILQQYTNREPILFPKDTCMGTCHFEVEAPGWDVECTESTESYHLATWHERNQYYDNTSSNGTLLKNSTYDGPNPVQMVFNIDVVYNYTLPDFKINNDYAGGFLYEIDLKVKRKSTPGGDGTMSIHSCRLIEAIIKYPLILQNSTATLGVMPLGVNRTVQRVYRNPEMETMGNMPSTLGGFWLALNGAFRTNSKLATLGYTWGLRDANPISSQYLRADNASDVGSANIVFDDPMADMVLMANELAFRTAYTTSSTVPGTVVMGATYNAYNLTSEQPYIVSPNLTFVARKIHQHSVVSSSTPTTVYSTHRGWLAGAAVLMCIASLLISVTYWGFWKLGRPVSMSPLEIARAFNAPIMQNTDPNATGNDLKIALGSERIYPRIAADSFSSSTEKLRSRESLS